MKIVLVSSFLSLLYSIHIFWPYGLKIGMVFKGTTKAREHIYLLSSREKEK